MSHFCPSMLYIPLVRAVYYHHYYYCCCRLFILLSSFAYTYKPFTYSWYTRVPSRYTVSPVNCRRTTYCWLITAHRVIGPSLAVKTFIYTRWILYADKQTFSISTKTPVTYLVPVPPNRKAAFQRHEKNNFVFCSMWIVFTDAVFRKLALFKRYKKRSIVFIAIFITTRKIMYSIVSRAGPARGSYDCIVQDNV